MNSIYSDPNIRGGEPCLHTTQTPVVQILNYLSDGYGIGHICEIFAIDYQALEDFMEEVAALVLKEIENK